MTARRRVRLHLVVISTLALAFSFGLSGCGNALPTDEHTSTETHRSDAPGSVTSVKVGAETFSGAGSKVIEVALPADVGSRESVWIGLSFRCEGAGAYSVIPTGEERLGARGARCLPGSPITYRYRLLNAAVPSSWTITVDPTCTWTLDSEILVERGTTDHG